MEQPNGVSPDAKPSPSPAAKAPAEPQNTEAKSDNYFLRHWRGELSLGISYWANNFLGTIALLFIATALGTWLGQSQSNYSALVLWIALYACTGLVTVWQIVGVWRSATRHVAQTGKKLWATIAQVMVVLAAFRVATDFLGTGVPAIQKSFEQAQWLNKWGTSQFRVLNNGTELEVSGGIGHGFAAEFDKSLDAAPSVRLVHVNLGSGGLVSEALTASNAIRKRGLPTYVSSSCVSACTIVFLGGTQRFVQQGASLGFHSPSAPGLTQSDMAAELEKHRQFLLSAGVSPQFASHVIATSPDDMWYPTGEELVSQGVATAITRGDEFATSGLGRHVPTRAEVAEQFGKIRIYKAIQQRDPAQYEQLVDLAYAGMSTGRPMDDIRLDSLPILSKMYMESLPYSSRDALIRTARLFVTEYRALQSAPGKTCIAYAMGNDATAANAAVRYFSKEITREEQETMADVIETSDRKRLIPPMADVQPQIAEATRIARQQVGDDVSLVGRLDDPTVDPAGACRALTAYFDAMASLAPDDSEMVLRAVFGAK